MVINVHPDATQKGGHMDFLEAKRALTDGYIAAGFEIARETDTQILLTYKDRLFIVAEDDIEAYASGQSLRAVTQAEPVECSMVNAAYRETGGPAPRSHPLALFAAA